MKTVSPTKVTDQDFQDIADAEDTLLDVVNRLAARGATTLPIIQAYELAQQAMETIRRHLNALDPQGLTHEIL